MPIRRSVQLTDLTCFRTTHIIGSWSGHTPNTGQSQNLQSSVNMLLVWLVLNSPLSQYQCSSQETDCPELRRPGAERYNFAQLVFTLQKTPCMLSTFTSAYYKRIVTMHQDVVLLIIMEETAQRSHASGKSSCLQDLVIMFEQHRKNRTLSCAVFHIRLVLLTSDPRQAI